MDVIFDLDGTLADASGREHYLSSSPKDWEGFHAASVDDEIIAPIGEIFRSLNRDNDWTQKPQIELHRIEIWTGREEKYRPDTIRWLQRNGLYGYRKLLMRPSGDYRKDHEMKAEWLMEFVAAHGKKPDLVFDDRASMVVFWRQQGIICADVAGNTF